MLNLTNHVILLTTIYREQILMLVLHEDKLCIYGKTKYLDVCKIFKDDIEDISVVVYPIDN